MLESQLLTAYVINLDRSVDRFKAVKASAEGTGIAVVRVDAVNGAAINLDEDLPGIDTGKFEEQHGRRPLPGEYGCYRSHLKALDLVIAAAEPLAIIAEDDILFTQDLDRRVRSIFEAAPGADIVKLVSHRTPAFVTFGVSDAGDVFGRCIHGPQGSAACYAVTLEGARRLRSQLEMMWLPYDVALERGWATNARTYTVELPLVDFQPERLESTIAGQGDYDSTKLAATNKLAAFWFRTGEYLSRTTYACEVGRLRLAIRALTSPSMGIALTVMTLILVSALWVETDAYRYVVLVLALIGFLTWATYYDRPSIRWPEILCFSWVAFVLTRFAVDLFISGGSETGSAEGIYLFPFLFSSVAYAYVPHPASIRRAVRPFMLISLAALAATVPFSQPLGDGRHEFLFMNNTIHSSVGAGFILLAALNFANLVLRQDSGWSRIVWIIVASLTIALAAAGIFLALSKGVWLALVAALAVQAVFQLAGMARYRATVVGATILALAICAGLVWQQVWDTVAPTAHTVTTIIQGVLETGDLGGAVQQAIASSQTPQSANERLMLWTNGLAAWAHNIPFGNGLYWESIFMSGPYKEVGYNLLHNGYLEIAVRYGLVGLAFYGFFFIWPVVQSRRAWRAGMVARETYGYMLVATVFFLVTLLSNSNNRLAIGESFMIIGPAFGFLCYFHLRAHSRKLK